MSRAYAPMLPADTVRIPWRLTREQASRIAAELSLPIEADIDGEPWLVRAVEGGACSRLLDGAPRRDGRRCGECGKLRQPGAGFFRGLAWFCSSTCHQDHRDHYADPDRGGATTEEQS